MQWDGLKAAPDSGVGRLNVKKLLLIFIVTSIICPSLYGIVINRFVSLGHYYDTAKDILIVRCISVPDRNHDPRSTDGTYTAEIEVLDVLTGDAKLGRLKMATFYDMSPGQMYLVSSARGKANADILAHDELSVVKISYYYNVDKYKKLHRNRKVYKIFKLRQDAVRTEMLILERERELLTKAVGRGRK